MQIICTIYSLLKKSFALNLQFHSYYTSDNSSTMTISIIVAKGKNNEIGKDNQLLWKLSDDLKLFKKTTVNHSIIMGRKTFESIGRALPKRRNIIISRNTDLTINGCEVVHSVEAALELCKDEKEIFIIGGGNLYTQTLPLTNKLFLSEVDGNFEAEVYFPEIKEEEWMLAHSEQFPRNEKNEYSFTFRKLVRR